MFTAQGHLGKGVCWDSIPATVPFVKSLPEGLPQTEGVTSISHKALYSLRETLICMQCW